MVQFFDRVKLKTGNFKGYILRIIAVIKVLSNKTIALWKFVKRKKSYVYN